MEELKDVCIHSTAIKLAGELKSLKIYDSLYKTVQKIVCKPNVDKFDMRNTLEEAIKATGLEIEIRNLVYHLIRNSIRNELKASLLNNDPLNYLKRAGMLWDRRVKKSLNAMCTELKILIHGQHRTTADREEILIKWDELSNYQIDLTNYRPVYAPKDLLDVLLSLRGPTKLNDNENVPKWEFSHIALPVKNLFELRSHFAELLKSDFNLDLTLNCKKVLSYKHSPLCQQLLKCGNTPTPYRGELWSYVLGSNVYSQQEQYWEQLKTNVLNIEHIVDKLIFKDVQLTASNDDQYFVFEDVLYQVLLCFSRDTEIADMIQIEPYNMTKGKQYDGPPCGVVPFHGICMYAAPFCYLFDCPRSLYFTFRAFYIRYCHRLTTINTHPQGIVSLCLLFEKLLQTHEPQLWSHFRELQISPIRIVFKWLMRAFSGHLMPDQLLILWDLILGFDSLDILALFSIIILSFRKESLMQVLTLDSIEAVLSDLSSIKVLPLIQLALSRD